MLDHLATDHAWGDAAASLLATAADDLDAGTPPAPTLLAYRGEEPVAVVTLRPFEPGDLLQALLEVLALLLPLGVDRLALSVSGRAWSLDDPIPPVTDGADLRTRVLLLTFADAHDRPCHTRVEVHPFEDEGDGWCFGPALDIDDAGAADAGLDQALTVLLDGRQELADSTDDRAIAAQLGRVLLLGHMLSLSPTTAEHLQDLVAG